MTIVPECLQLQEKWYEKFSKFSILHTNFFLTFLKLVFNFVNIIAKNFIISDRSRHNKILSVEIVRCEMALVSQPITKCVEVRDIM